MANSTTKLVIEHLDQIQDLTSSGKHQALVKLGHFLDGLASGANGRGVAVEVWRNSTAPVKSFGTIAVSGSDTGTYTATINGVGVTATGTGNDVTTCTAIAAAVNASTNALVQYLVESSNFQANVACSSIAAGQTLTLTLTADDRQWTFAAVSGTANAYQFDISGNDSADATALANAINAMPFLNHHVFAYTSTSNVKIQQRRGTAATFSASKNGAGMTLTANAASAVVGISALQPGTLSNAITLAASGTGATASGARLTGGTGNDAAATRYDL